MPTPPLPPCRPGAVLAGLWAASLAWPLATQASPAAAVVRQILGGEELYIEQRQAHVNEPAYIPERIHTRNTRAQLGFANGAAGRLNRFSQLRLGSSCFLLREGEVLVSGKQSGCTSSSRLSTRGTNYLLTLLESGEAEVTVLEGVVEVQRLVAGQATGEQAIAVEGGNRVRLSAEGTLVWQRALTAAEYAAILRGPLFEGFTEPLPGLPALETFLQRRFPGVLPARTSAERNPDPLVERINRIRAQSGRPALQPLPAALASENAAYLSPVLEGILQSGTCDHDRSRWEHFQGRMASTAKLMPTSEVIACPMPAASWNPEVIVSRWMGSPLHTQILINRPRAQAIDCVKVVRAGKAAGVCTLWSPAPGAAP